MRLLLTRPHEESIRLAERLQALGHQTVIAPLLTIRPRPGVTLSLDGVRGLLATSANGVRALAAALPGRHLPVYAVGPSTAQAARAAGFTHVAVAAGDVDALGELVLSKIAPGDGRLLHVAGRDVAGDLAGFLRGHGYQVERIALYEAVEATALPPSVAAELAAGGFDGGLFFSPRTAATFVTLVERAGIHDGLPALVAFCLSAAVAKTFDRLPVGAVAVAEQTTEDSLIARIGNWNL